MAGCCTPRHATSSDISVVWHIENHATGSTRRAGPEMCVRDNATSGVPPYTHYSSSRLTRPVSSSSLLFFSLTTHPVSLPLAMEPSSRLIFSASAPPPSFALLWSLVSLDRPPPVPAAACNRPACPVDLRHLRPPAQAAGKP
jgi:hypothetical protein